MIVLADTHALAWWLESNPRLSRPAQALLDDPEAYLLVPTIVLVELKYMGLKLRIEDYMEPELAGLRQARDVAILDLTEDVVARMPLTLNIHDAIIVASALTWAGRSGVAVRVITKDARIAGCGLVETVW